MSEIPMRPGFGEAIPWFRAPSLNGPKEYSIDIAGGRPVLLLFFGSAALPVAAEALALVQAHRALFDDVHASFFGVTIDPGDVANQRIAMQLPGIRFFLDYDRRISRQFVAEKDGQYGPFWLLLDKTLRVVAEFPVREGAAAIRQLQQFTAASTAPDWAPVVMIPNILEPEYCKLLIDLYNSGDVRESGIMREIGGKTKLVHDAAFKVRRDFEMPNSQIAQQIIARLQARMMPMVRRAFQFEAQHVERLIIGCYDESDGGHFKAHRDDTSKGTAHRQFAVTINLNADEYEGGDLSFPEFGDRKYRPPTGSAIVFSCSLLHQVSPVTKGRRYALLPFLYDDNAAKIRDANLHLLDLDPLVVAPIRAAAS